MGNMEGGKQTGKEISIRQKYKPNDCSSLLMPQVGIAHPPNVEVLYIDVPVGGSLPLAPQQQTLLSRGL